MKPYKKLHPFYDFFRCLDILFVTISLGVKWNLKMCTGNIGNVPLVLISALCRDKSNPFGDSEKCSQDGNAYISFGQWVSYKQIQ